MEHHRRKEDAELVTSRGFDSTSTSLGDDAGRKIIQDQAYGEGSLESGTRGDRCWQCMAQVLAIADVERKKWVVWRVTEDITAEVGDGPVQKKVYRPHP